MLTARRARTTARRQGRDAARGSVLLLMPSAVLVICVLGALALDIGQSRVRARELQAVAASAANDALAAVDTDELRSSGRVVIDQRRAAEVVAASVALGPLPAATVEAVQVLSDHTGRIEIVVRLGLDVDLILTPAIAGAARDIHVSATERVLVLD